MSGLHAAQTTPKATTAKADDSFGIEIHGANGSQFTKAHRDADGKPIDAATFAKGAKNGSKFTPAFDSVKKFTTLSLNSAAASDGLAVKVGGKLPDFHLSTLDKRGASSAQIIGKPTLVDFSFPIAWAVSRSCRRSMPVRRNIRR